MNFTGQDIVHISLTLMVWFLFTIGQGLAIGYASNVLSFRSRSIFNQLNMAPILFVGVMPCLYNLAALVGGFNSAVLLSLTVLAASILIVIRRRSTLIRKCKHLLKDLLANRFFLLICAIWLFLSLTMLVDVQIRDKLYLSVTMYDHSSKVAIADAIARNGIPVKNPCFSPGRLVAMYYHYYWTMLCTIVSAFSGSMYDTRATVLSGVIWTGTVFLCFLRLCAGYFRTLYVPRRQLTLWALSLLAVSNLYGLITLPMNLVLWFTHHQLFASFGAWTVDMNWPFVQAMLWVPQHVAGLIAGMFGSIILLEATRAARGREGICLIGIAGICLSSNFGLSTYIAIGFAVSWVAWALLNLSQRRANEFAATVSAACVSLLLTIPYLKELIGGQGHCAQLTFEVRHFEIIDCLFPGLTHAPIIHQLAYLLLLPVNYLVGFGFIIVAAVFHWTGRRVSRNPLEAKELFLVVMAAASLILGSFVRSRYNFNDFGYRVIMPAHLAILLWAAYYLARQQQHKALNLSRSVFSLIAIGIFTFVYALYGDRTAAFFVKSGERMYAVRSIYETLSRKLPLNAVVQHNPYYSLSSFFGLDVFANLYSHRQVVCADKISGEPNVPDKGEYEQVTSDLVMLFDNASLSEAVAICRRFKIDVLLVKDTDKIWSNKSSWALKYPVIAQNKYARAYLIKALPINFY